MPFVFAAAIMVASCGKKLTATGEVISSSVPSAAPSAATTAGVPQSVAACRTGDRGACTVACDGNDLPSCLALGNVLLKSGTPSERLLCEPPLRKACNGSVGKACSTLASRCLVVIGFGQGKEEDGKRERFALNQRSCELGDADGCFNIGKNYKDGYGVEQDENKSTQFFAKALARYPTECDGGDAKSCLSLAMLYDPASRSKLLDKDANRAATLFKKACDGGEQMGCFNATRLGAEPVAAGAAASAPMLPPADCLPCRTQEDFDSAAVKHTKCCETHACKTDSECPRGRVCCRIPGGELCASERRCTGPNRVEQ